MTGAHRSREQVDRVGQNLFDLMHPSVALGANVEKRQRGAANRKHELKNAKWKQSERFSSDVGRNENDEAESQDVPGAIGQARLIDHRLQSFHQLQPRKERNARRLLLAEQ